MNKIKKRIMSVFMAMCVVLPSSVCYAGRHKKGIPTRGASRGDEARARVDDLIGRVSNLLVTAKPAKGPVIIPDGFFEFKYDDSCRTFEIIYDFAEFFALYFKPVSEGESTDAWLYRGTTLFLNLIKRFQYFDQNHLDDVDRQFCCQLALLALSMCDTRREGLYDEWCRMLDPYMSPDLARFKVEFDRANKAADRAKMTDLDKKEKSWRYCIRTTGGSVIRRANVELWTARSLKQFDYSDHTRRFLDYVRGFHGPLATLLYQARNMMSGMRADLSDRTINAARDAVRQCEEQITLFCRENPTRRVSYIQVLAELDGYAREIAMAKEKLDASTSITQARHKLDVVLSHLGDGRMEVETAQEVCDECHRKYDEYKDKLDESTKLETARILGLCDGQIQRIVTAEYIESVHALGRAADGCIRALFKENSPEILDAAKQAQKKYKEKLDECPQKYAGAIKASAEYKELFQHYGVNQQNIVNAEAFHAQAVENEKIMLELQQRTENSLKALKMKQQRDKDKRNLESKPAPEVSRAPERTGPFEVVFLCDPSVSGNPLGYLEDHSQYIPLWNAWYANARAGVPEGGEMDQCKYGNKIFKNEDKRNLDIEMKDGHPFIHKYRGGLEGGRTGEKGRKSGFRIVWYRERTSGRIVVLYVGDPFGCPESHDNPWKTKFIKADWPYVNLGTHET